MRVNCNISAIIANNQLGKSENSLDTAIERLSSGLRINHAEDDAAGMAISKKMHAQIKGLEQATRNSSDGISVVQTAESAMGEVENMLQRARELSVQAADGTYNEDDLKSIQDEIDQICKEIDRVSSDTEFNTMPLLDGTLSRRSYSDVKGVDVTSLSTNVISGEYSISITEAATAATAEATTFSGTVTEDKTGTITINGAKVTVAKGDTLDSVYSKLIAAGDAAGVTVGNNATAGGGIASATKISFTSNTSGSNEELNIQFSNAGVASLLGMSTSNVSYGTDCKVVPGDGFSKTAVAMAVGNRVTISDVNSFSMKLEIDDDMTADNVKLDITDIGIMNIQVGAIEGQQINIEIPKVDTHTLGIDGINVSTNAGAAKAIVKLDDAITQISSFRSRLGAYQNRMETTVQSLNSYNENITSALSRIEDCDMAEEMTAYTSSNVISQAATSILSQANERPQTVLQLLQ